MSNFSICFSIINCSQRICRLIFRGQVELSKRKNFSISFSVIDCSQRISRLIFRGQVESSKKRNFSIYFSIIYGCECHTLTLKKPFLFLLLFLVKMFVNILTIQKIKSRKGQKYYLTHY